MGSNSHKDTTKLSNKKTTPCFTDLFACELIGQEIEQTHGTALHGSTLTFEAGRTYTATIYADAPDADYATNPQAYVISKRQVTSADTLGLDMARGGGFAISFK